MTLDGISGPSRPAEPTPRRTPPPPAPEPQHGRPVPRPDGDAYHAGRSHADFGQPMSPDPTELPPPSFATRDGNHDGQLTGLEMAGAAADDHNQDGRITADEFLASARAQRHAERLARVNADFEQRDADHDGQLTGQEAQGLGNGAPLDFQGYQQARHEAWVQRTEAQAAKQAAPAFETLDQNHDGVLAGDEVKHAWQETGDGMDAPFHTMPDGQIDQHEFALAYRDHQQAQHQAAVDEAILGGKYDTGTPQPDRFMQMGGNIMAMGRLGGEAAARHLASQDDFSVTAQAANDTPEGAGDARKLPMYPNLAAFQQDLQDHPDKFPPGSTVAYDFEGWKYTSKAEQADPEAAFKAFSDVCKQNGLKLAIIPYPQFSALGEDVNYKGFVDQNIAGLAAKYADTVVIQAQQLERDPAAYRKFVQQTAQQARSANPNVTYMTELTGNGATTEQLRAAYDAVRDLTDGFYLAGAKPEAQQAMAGFLAGL